MTHPPTQALDSDGERPNLVATALACVLREAAGIASAPFDRPPPPA